MYAINKCIGCGYCIDKCENEALSKTKDGILTSKENCIICGKCTDVCPSKAMEMSGRRWTKAELMKEIKKETLLIDSSEGGVTFCGGEPLLYPEFLFDMLRECGEEDIHRAVDTTLFASWDVIEKIATETDLFLVDLKVMDDAKHKKYTGVSNRLILENIKKLSGHGSRFLIRIPLIEGINADKENLIESADFLASLPCKPEVINLLPYHDIAKGKHKRLGSEYNSGRVAMSEPSEDTKKMALEIFAERGLEVVLGG